MRTCDYCHRPLKPDADYRRRTCGDSCRTAKSRKARRQRFIEMIADNGTTRRDLVEAFAHTY